VRFFEKLIAQALKEKDSSIEGIVLGWHASVVRLRDGRVGIGTVPPGDKIPLDTREEHTRHLLSSSAHGLVSLFASPYPQEFAVASAIVSALVPASKCSLPLDSIAGIPENDSVAVIGYDKILIPHLRDWGWNMSILDNQREAPDIFPEHAASEKLPSCQWCWLTAEAFRNRWFTFIQPYISHMKGIFLQGPGLPCLPSLFREAGITHLILPTISPTEEMNVTQYISAGGHPMLCRDISWNVYFL
jgi:uncharacterized protein (DUF4213/DUF364 family)